MSEAGPKTQDRRARPMFDRVMKRNTMQRLLLTIALASITAIVAAACAADDPIGAFNDSVCSLDDAQDEPGDRVDEPDDHGEEPDEHEPTVADVVVEMDMLEFGYSCDLPPIEVGTVVEFHMTNVGQVEHEAVFGDLAAQNEAEAQMAEVDTDADHGDDAHGTPTLVLAPDESGTIVVSFDEPGAFIIGCHVPGHWAAGMRSDYDVTA